MERPSKKIPRGPTPKERTNFEVMVERVENLDFDMESAFERFDQYDDTITRLEHDVNEGKLARQQLAMSITELKKKFPRDFSAGRFLASFKMLEDMSEVLHEDLKKVEKHLGFGDYTRHRSRILAHKAAAMPQPIDGNYDEKMVEATELIIAAGFSPMTPSLLAEDDDRRTCGREDVGEPESSERVIMAQPRSRQWTPAKRAPEVMEIPVLDELYRMAQERAGVVVTARNVVELYRDFLTEGKELYAIKTSIEKALGSFALPGESLADTAARIGSVANKMSDPVKTVMGECKAVKAKVDEAMDRLRCNDLERVEDRITELNRSSGDISANVKELQAHFMSIDSLPASIDSLNGTLIRLEKLTTDSSVVTEVKTPELTAGDWGFQNADDPIYRETYKEKARQLNTALSRAIETVLMWTLKEGKGFKRDVVAVLIDAAMLNVIIPAISVIGIDGTVVKEVTDLAKHEINRYFGMVH